MAKVKPFVRWVGGKTKILDIVLNEFPTEMNNYHEPFLGGGSILFELLQRVKDGKIKVNGKIYAYDINPYLIASYIRIRDNPKKFREDIQVYIDKYGLDPKSYEALRKEFVQGQINGDIRTPEMFVLLNRRCFRGVYRENLSGLYNVPVDHKIKPWIPTLEDLKAVSNLIQGVRFKCRPFIESLKQSSIKNNDFVYLDPPYVKKDTNSFVSYTNEGFDVDSCKELFRITKRLPRFVMSNADAPLIHQQFKEHNIIEVSTTHSVDSKDPGKKVIEVLITNF